VCNQLFLPVIYLFPDLNIKTEPDADTASTENLTLESMISSPVASSMTGLKSLIDMDGTQQAGEEITLFSMMRTINDNVKKAKQKEKQKEESVVEPVKKAAQSVVNDSKASKSARRTSMETSAQAAG